MSGGGRRGAGDGGGAVSGAADQSGVHASASVVVPVHRGRVPDAGSFIFLCFFLKLLFGHIRKLIFLLYLAIFYLFLKTH